ALTALVPAAVRLAFATPAAGSSAAVVLAQGVIQAMSIGKTIAVMGVFVLAAGLVSGLGLVAADGPGPKVAQTEPPKAARPSGKPAKAPAADPTPAKEREDEL